MDDPYGDDLDAMLWRAERDIVAYSEEHIHAAQFRTVAEARAWLAGHEPPFHVPLVVRAFEGDAFVAIITEERELGEGVTFFQSHRFNHEVGQLEQPRVEWIAASPLGTDADDWFISSQGEPSRHWLEGTCLDGRTVDSAGAEYCFDETTLQRYLTSEFMPDVSRWLAVNLPGSPSLIAFPCEGTVLYLRTDSDGASVSLVALPKAVFDEEEGQRKGFRDRWSQWYEATPAPDVVAATITRLEGELRARIDAEEN